MPFKMFEEVDKTGAAGKLEKQLNDWKKSLPVGVRVRRTQLAANDHRVYAMVDYEEDVRPPADLR
jgi:hypothetical protein